MHAWVYSKKVSVAWQVGNMKAEYHAVGEYIKAILRGKSCHKCQVGSQVLITSVDSLVTTTEFVPEDLSQLSCQEHEVWDVKAGLHPSHMPWNRDNNTSRQEEINQR